MYFTDNPIADAERYAAEQEEALDKLPRCEYCNKPIDDDYLFEINDEVICEGCLNKHFRKGVDDYVG